MPRIQLTLQNLVPRAPWWPDEDALGGRLSALVTDAVARGGAPTVAVVARQDRVTLVPLAPLVQARWNLPGFLAGLSRWQERGDEPAPEAVGVMGRMRFRSGPDALWVPLAVVFLEWPDGRWWHWRALVDADGKLIADSAVTSRAVDGLPRPGGLGGWWRLGRLQTPRLDFQPSVPPVATEVVQ